MTLSDEALWSLNYWMTRRRELRSRTSASRKQVVSIFVAGVSDPNSRPEEECVALLEELELEIGNRVEAQVEYKDRARHIGIGSK